MSESTEARPLARPLSGPHRGGVRQATFVEMHRAQAEVVAAVMAAREMPRDVPSAVADMNDGCGRRSMANRAFFRYSRGGKPITGGTIQLAKFLASCWGNLQYGLTELSRDDDESQMQAWAWDLQKNNRPTTTFIVPHGRISAEEYRALVDPRDVYENNANMGARRMREMIFNVLPPWFLDEAIARCRKTLAEGEEGEEKVEFPVRLANMMAAFQKIGVTRRQIEEKQGRGLEEFTPEDVATLTVVYQSLRQGTTTRADEFEADRGTLPGDAPAAAVRPVDEAVVQEHLSPAQQEAQEAGAGAEESGAAEAGEAASAEQAPARAAAARRPGRASNDAQHAKMFALMRDGGFPTLHAVLYAGATLAGVEPRGSLTQFTTVELSKAINTLTGWAKANALHEKLDELLPGEDDVSAWAPVEAARQAYLEANGRTQEGDPEGGGTDTD